MTHRLDMNGGGNGSGMKNGLAVFLFLIGLGASCLALFLWQLHPWISAGTAVLSGKWRFGDCEFQVWQRKNQSVLEPFADGLFVRRGTNEWQVFCFDIQDRYSPKIELRQVGTKVEVFRTGENRGVFDMSNGTFCRAPNRPVFTPDKIGSASEPPGEWWLRQSSKRP